MATTTLTPPLKVHGGKAYLARRIVELMKDVPHVHFVEPFFGGGSIKQRKCEAIWCNF